MASHPEHDRLISSADRIAKEAYSFLRRREFAIYSVILFGIPRFAKSGQVRSESRGSARQEAPWQWSVGDARAGLRSG
jgi:hypothetical protein